DDPEPDVFHADFLPDRRALAEQLARDRLPDEADRGGAADLLVGERLALGQREHGADLQVVRRAPFHLPGVVILVAIYELRAPVDGRRDPAQGGTLAAQGVGVLRGEGDAG